MELNRQEFEEILDQKLDQKFAAFEKKLDVRFQGIDLKFIQLEEKFDQKLADQTKELKTFAKEETMRLARVVLTGIVEPMEKRFDQLEARLDRHLQY